FYKILSLGGNIFTRISKLYFGDRGLFIKKTTFNKMSGFKEMPIMEDVNFSAKMNKEGKTSMLKGPVITSGRKFEKEPFWKILFLIFWSLSAYMIGLDPLKIRKKYYGF
ncbi:MAG: TIGR04283 family arsenosugar biosynthesis glycosyltransferase, partial [Actinomycetota bacterium]